MQMNSTLALCWLVTYGISALGPIVCGSNCLKVFCGLLVCQAANHCVWVTLRYTGLSRYIRLQSATLPGLLCSCTMFEKILVLSLCFALAGTFPILFSEIINPVSPKDGPGSLDGQGFISFLNFFGVPGFPGISRFVSILDFLDDPSFLGVPDSFNVPGSISALDLTGVPDSISVPPSIPWLHFTNVSGSLDLSNSTTDPNATAGSEFTGEIKVVAVPGVIPQASPTIVLDYSGSVEWTGDSEFPSQEQVSSTTSWSIINEAESTTVMSPENTQAYGIATDVE